MPQLAGWEARVKIGNYTSAGHEDPTTNYFKVKRYSIDFEAPGLDVSNTEGVAGNEYNTTAARGYQAIIPNIGRARVMLSQATFDSDDSPFDAPYSLAEGDYIRLEIYPDGQNDPIEVTSLMITKLSYSGEVGQAQPFTLEGESDGDYTTT